MHSLAKTFTRRLSLAFTILLSALQLSAQSNTPPLAKSALPPLAWSSWNSFSNLIDSNITMQQARALASSGLQKAGYQYVNIDEGWWLGDRDAEGHFIVDPKKWPAIAPGDKPGNMANIVRYIHSLGLKAGMYTDAGTEGCSIFPDIGPAYFHVGSQGHYEQDFLQFAQWGFDYVKVDWCGGDKANLSADVQYGEIARAISRAEQITGKRLYYSICNWGKQGPWTWGPGVGGSPQDIWRVSDDIVAPVVEAGPNHGRKVAFDKMLRNFDQGVHPEAQHTGYYNDPDMMVLGMPGLNAEQNRLHMALWAISGAPLIIGADITKLDADTLAILSNPDAIAIDQDPLGLQAVKVKEISSGLEVWSKFQQTPGLRAVLLLNRTYFPAPMSVDWADLGLEADSASVRDVWAGKDMGQLKGPFAATVPAQAGLLLIVRGSEGEFAHYKPDADISAGEKAITDPQTVFAGVSQVSSPFAQVKITFTNSAKITKVIDLYANAETSTRVAFPPTGAAEASVWIQAKLDRAGKTNELNFSAAPDSELKIRAIDVH
ncbi:Alpha-galactosidase precursor (plasmid) [Acidisarcina polymorpha]|uniref:Alpha-galactosidase n=1 Tax=Acidisarcina polymorpha TaxID=2211140 RepID=A0A2Z5GB90_9BACT|nr:glycoside hydrolase family 27 protein [Acidisarcina polymorpha]AXC16190.1 Alpha-galactosidase precursor [Acidisarcina polymorpha]